MSSHPDSANAMMRRLGRSARAKASLALDESPVGDRFAHAGTTALRTLRASPTYLPTEPPTEFRVLAFGKTETKKGAYLVSDQGAAIMAAFAEHGTDLVPIDYEHGQVIAPDKGRAIAAGWFRPEVREDGLWATEVHWTPAARKHLSDREFRHISPAMLVDQDTGEVKRLINVALTNLPATVDAVPLVAHDDGHTTPPEKDTIRMDTLLKTLGAADEAQAVKIVTTFNQIASELKSLTGASSIDGIVANVKALSELPAKVAALETEVASARETETARKREALITELSEAGKLTPGLFSWAATQSLDSLKAFGDAAPVHSVASEPAVEAEPAKVLSDSDREAFKLMGLTDDEIAAEVK